MPDIASANVGWLHQFDRTDYGTLVLCDHGRWGVAGRGGRPIVGGRFVRARRANVPGAGRHGPCARASRLPSSQTCPVCPDRTHFASANVGWLHTQRGISVLHVT